MMTTGVPSIHHVAVGRDGKEVVRRIARMAGGAVILGLLAAASPIEAQQFASTFDQLSVLVKPGDTVSVTDDTGRETRGTIAALSPSSLELMVAGTRQSFLEGQTRTIRHRRSDSLGIDAIFRSNEVIFVRSPRASVKSTVSPFLTGGRAGARVSLRF